MVCRPAPELEVIRTDFPRNGYRAVVFDFDGTLSLLRRNWQGVMVPMMVDWLLQLRTGESPEQLKELVEGFVIELTGRPTMVQMQRLVEEIERRGHKAQPASYYLDCYQANARIRAVLRGHASPDAMAVSGSRRFLQELQRRNLLLVLVSGTELRDVRHELQVLKLAEYFEPRVYGPVNQDPTFSKFTIMQELVAQGLPGESLMAIGDGPAEIQAIKRIGGLAIGLASNEITGTGIDPLKREHLIRAGADLIIGNYRCWRTLFERLGLMEVPA
jgi:phosphoglycolate phosphatase